MPTCAPANGAPQDVNFTYTSAAATRMAFRGQTVGLVGLGRIGTRVAQLLAPWRVRIIAYDPYVQPAHFLIHGVEAGRL